MEQHVAGNARDLAVRVGTKIILEMCSVMLSLTIYTGKWLNRRLFSLVEITDRSEQQMLSSVSSDAGT